MNMIAVFNKPSRFSLRFTALSTVFALAAFAVAASGCSDDDEPVAGGAAGKAGAAGAAGKAGAAGASAGNGGSSAGNGGSSAGTGGSAGATGGTAGSAGATGGSAGATGGTAGSAGATGGSAGATGGTAGSAGATGGSAGSAGASGGNAGTGGAAGLAVGTPVIIKASETGHDRFLSVNFASDGTAYAVGQIQDTAAATDDIAIFVAKLKADGNIDDSWADSGLSRHNLTVGVNGEIPRGILVQADGKILVGATGEHVEATGAGGAGGAAGAGGANAKDRDIIILRLNADGTKDTSFGTGGVKTLDLSPGVEIDASTYTADEQYGFALQTDGKIVVSGAKKRDDGTDRDHVVLRLLANGDLDTSFATQGVYSVDIAQQSANPRTVTILEDGSIVSSGYSKTAGANGVVTPVVFKLDKDGKLVSTFGTNGIFAPELLGHTAEAYGSIVQGDKLVFIGYGKSAAADKLDWISWRLDNAGALDKTYAAATDGVLKIDFKSLDDNGRGLVALPDGRTLFVGRVGAGADPNTYDGGIAVVSANGELDGSFGTGGKLVQDLGGANDQWWVARTSPDKKRIVVVGVSGTTSTNDNSAVTTITLP